MWFFSPLLSYHLQPASPPWLAGHHVDTILQRIKSGHVHCAQNRQNITPTIAKILIPLHKAIGECKTKKEKIVWNDERRHAFEEAKDALAEATLLHHPSADAEMMLTVDASDTAMGGQIEQKLGNWFVPIAFFSKKLTPAERKYSAFDRELLAIYLSLIHI